jgi:hypothetical protein
MKEREQYSNKHHPSKEYPISNLEDGLYWIRQMQVIEVFSTSHSTNFNPSDAPSDFKPSIHLSRHPSLLSTPVVIFPSNYNISPSQTPSKIKSPNMDTIPSGVTVIKSFPPDSSISSDFPAIKYPTHDPSIFSSEWDGSSSPNSDQGKPDDQDITSLPTFNPTRIPSRMIEIVEKPSTNTIPPNSNSWYPSDFDKTFPTFDPTSHPSSIRSSRIPSPFDGTTNPTTVLSSSIHSIEPSLLILSSPYADFHSSSFPSATIPQVINPSNSPPPLSDHPEIGLISPDDDLSTISNLSLTLYPTFNPTSFSLNTKKPSELVARGSNFPSTLSDMNATTFAPYLSTVPLSTSKNPSNPPSKLRTPTDSNIPSMLTMLSNSSSIIPSFMPPKNPSVTISPSSMNPTVPLSTSKNPSNPPSKLRTPTDSNIPSIFTMLSNSSSLIPSLMPSKNPFLTLSPLSMNPTSEGDPKLHSSLPSPIIHSSENETENNVESPITLIPWSQVPNPAIQEMPMLPNAIPQFSPFPYYNYTNIPIAIAVNQTVAPSSNSSLTRSSSQLGVGAFAFIGVGSGVALIVIVYALVKVSLSTGAVSTTAVGTSSASVYATTPAAMPSNTSGEHLSTTTTTVAPAMSTVAATVSAPVLDLELNEEGPEIWT